MTWCRENSPDLVLLDRMLPGKNGLDICKEIRTFSSLPIIIVTAKVEEIDRLLGLELGADDYICKPFSPAKCGTGQNRAATQTANPAAVAHPAWSSTRNATRQPFTARSSISRQWSSNSSAFFFDHPGRIYSRGQLMDRIYPDQRVVSDRTIDSHIKKLRKKIADTSFDDELIHSIYGVGYKFEM